MFSCYLQVSDEGIKKLRHICFTVMFLMFDYWATASDSTWWVTATAVTALLSALDKVQWPSMMYALENARYGNGNNPPFTQIFKKCCHASMFTTSSLTSKGKKEKLHERVIDYTISVPVACYFLSPTGSRLCCTSPGARRRQ